MDVMDFPDFRDLPRQNLTAVIKQLYCSDHRPNRSEIRCIKKDVGIMKLNLNMLKNFRDFLTQNLAQISRRPRRA